MTSTAQAPDRMLSVDFFRGFTMFLLVSGFGQLFDPASKNAVAAFLGLQLEHAEWDGLMFWDLIQPFFMFIVGVSMPFSFYKRWQKGDSWNKTALSALRRSLLLLFLGWLIDLRTDYATFTNVLAQIAFTYFIAFLLLKKALKWQLMVSFALLIVTDLLYRYWSVPGFDQPFVADHNFGSWVDMQLMGHLSDDRWVAFNAVPTAAHTIWGVVAGRILMKHISHQKKILTLLIPGIAAVIIGYGLSPLVPMIKRTCTSSFVIASGGWAVVSLAFSYWLIDVLKAKRIGFFFAVVGMNPLFIYLFVHAGGAGMLRELISPLNYHIFGWGGPDFLHTINILMVSAMLWYICYFMYKRKVFIRI